MVRLNIENDRSIDKGDGVLANPSPKVKEIKEPNKDLISTFKPGTIWNVVTVNPPDSCVITNVSEKFLFFEGPCSRPKQSWEQYSYPVKYKRLKMLILRLLQGKAHYFELHFEVSHSVPLGRLHCHLLVHWKDHIFSSMFFKKLISIMQNGIPPYAKKLLQSVKNHSVNVYTLSPSYFSNNTDNVESYSYLWKEHKEAVLHKFIPCRS